MDEFKRIVLQEHEKLIYDDVVDIEEILDHLRSENILQDYERQAITSSNNSTEKLVKVLLNKSDGSWFEKLVYALKKDYEWISRSLQHQFDSQKKEKLTFYLRGRGNVPPLPQHNIIRQHHVELLRTEIRHLKRDNFLVVHGMSGLGKTCLVVDALHDVHVLEESMNGCVYWLSVGDIRGDPDDLQCRQLQEKLCGMVNLPVNNKQNLLYELTHHFTKPPNHSALLVLDKVRSAKVVEALSVGCKILVTTQDCDVVQRKHEKKLFPVNDGFTESESVQLLQDFIQSDLQPHIKDRAIKIHRAWRGHPMVIGLIGGELSEFKEESQKNDRRWKEYERTVQYGNNNDAVRRRSIVEEQIKAIINLTTDKLEEQEKNLFRKLAILAEDTNLTVDVLQILWGMPRRKVEKTIEHFYRRSLVFKKFNPSLQETVYGIHDLIMHHLKSDLSDTELKDMHKDLVLKYNNACHGNFANLPKDNYIFSYLCHHIENAGKWDDFRDQFFSLQYIEAKLKASSPGDLLLDLCKYSSGLVGRFTAYNQKIKDIEKFVNDSGWDIHQGEVDVFQCALIQPETSFLHEKAAQFVCSDHSSKVYFRSLNTPERPKDLEKEIPNISSISIVSPNSLSQASGRVLVYPDKNGYITEIDMHYRLDRRSFKERSKVVLVKMSPLHDKFLSALEDGHVNLWSLNRNESNADTPPPILKQINHEPHFPDIRTTPSLSYKHSRKVTCACFSNDGKYIVSSSEDGSWVVWDLEENISVKKLNLLPNPIARSCCFLKGDSLVVFGCRNFQLFFYDLTTDRYCWEDLGMNNYGSILSLLCVTDETRTLLVVQERRVLLLTWKEEILKHRRDGPRPLELDSLKIRELPSENETITSAVYHPKHYLLLGTTHGCLLYSDILEDHFTLSKFGSSEIRAVDMVSGRIAFAQPSLVKICWPNPDKGPEKQPKSAHLGWTLTDVSVFSTATYDGDIQVMHDGLVKVHHTCKDACVVRVSTFGNHVLIGTEDGKVFLFDSLSEKRQLLQFDFPESEILYLSVGMYHAKPVYLASANSGLEGSYSLQAQFIHNELKKSDDLKATVVRAFVCRRHDFIIAVLKNYCIVAWDLKSKEDFSYLVQEGRQSASINSACLSTQEDILVLTDEESCFHVISLVWPEPESLNDTNSNMNSASIFGGSRNLGKLKFPFVDHIPHFAAEPADEVDGMQQSLSQKVDLKGSMKTYPLQSGSWCCCICNKGTFAVISQNDNISVWNLKKKINVCPVFQIFKNRRANVKQLQFAPYNEVKFSGKTWGLVLFVVTDCISLWDLSSFIDVDSSNSNKKPECIGCVSASGNILSELCINPSFTKFATFDEYASYFLWEVYQRNASNSLDENSSLG